MTESLATHLTIVTQENIEPLAADFRRDARSLQKRDIPIVLSETYSDGTAFFTFELDRASEAERRSFCLNAARTMAAHVLREREPAIIRRLLKGQFSFLDDSSRATLDDTLPRFLDHEKTRRRRRKLLLLSFLQHFLEEGDVNVDDLIDFRLRTYWEYLSYLLICQINEIFQAEARAELLSLLLYCPEFDE